MKKQSLISSNLFSKKQVILCLYAFLLSLPLNCISAQLPWSDPATWTSFGSTKPNTDEDVTIPSGIHILLDEDTPDLGGLTIEGILTFDNQSLNLTADWILIMGALHIGSESSPFAHQAVITLNATDMNENIMNMGTRGLMVMGGTLELHGTPPTIPWTKINAHANAGSTSLTLMESVNWNVNDQIVIGPTDYYPETGQTSFSQRVTLTQVISNQLTINTGLNAFRWGLLQYATNTGISLSSTNQVVPNASPTPTILDERAPVGNLTRNIVIQSPEDDLWNNNEFGCHLMLMRMGMTFPIAHVNGVEFRRGGQNGILGRYPFHWHMLSYEDCQDPSGNCQTLADATGQYIRNSTINQSRNRGIVIHGTNGVSVENNVLYDIRGHAVFTEDASERRNIIDGNLVLHVRNPLNPLKVHESGEHSSSGFWVSNPDNTIINNTAADCVSKGFWLPFPTHPWGLSEQVDIHPSWMTFGVFDNNTAHSNRREGLFIDLVEIDNNGNVGTHQYISTSDGEQPSHPFSTVQRFQLTRLNIWKHGAQGIWDNASAVDNFETVIADVCTRSFTGVGVNGLIERCLAIGTSLNHLMNGYARPNIVLPEPNVPAAFATYHSTFDIRNNIVLEFPAIANHTSGMFSTNDYYIRPVEKGQVRNLNNIGINTHPGVKREEPYYYMALAGALWDPNDSWGGTVEDSTYLVYDIPFFTHGLTTEAVPPSAASGGVLAHGPYFGFNDFIINEANAEWEDIMEIDVDRVDESLTVIDNWNIPAAPSTAFPLAHMRHFATHPTGHYQLTFPDIPNVTDVAISVENMLTEEDYQIIAIEYDGSENIAQVFTTSYGDPLNSVLTTWPTSGPYKHIFQAVANRQAVIDSPTGETYWHDTANDLVWMKVRGGIEQLWDPANFSAISEELLYWRFWLRIHSYSGASMPVELTHFSAKITNKNKVKLNWETATEVGNQQFEIERSLDGKQWEVLSKVKGAGDSFERLVYEYLDENPLKDISYYRLKQVDLNGDFTYSDMKIVLFEKASELDIYPNPASDFLHLNLNSTFEKIKLDILNVSGQSISHQSFDNLQHLSLNIKHLEAGTYWLHIQTEKGSEYLKFAKL